MAQPKQIEVNLIACTPKRSYLCISLVKVKKYLQKRIPLKTVRNTVRNKKKTATNH